MARFTNDMDSFGQGLNTLMSKVIREPHAVRDLPGWGPLDQLAADLLDVDSGADLRRDDLPRRQDHEARRQALAREHVNDLQDPSGELPGDQDRQGVRDRAGRAPAILRRDQEPLPQERAGGDDRRHVRPGAGNADPHHRGHRASGRLVPGPEPDDLPGPGSLPAPARRRTDGDPGPADPLHDAAPRLQTRSESWRTCTPRSSGRRPRPTGSAPHGPSAQRSPRTSVQPRLPRHRQSGRVRPGRLRLQRRGALCSTGSA